MSSARSGARNTKKRRRKSSAKHAAVGLEKARSTTPSTVAVGVEEGGSPPLKRRKGTVCLEDIVEEISRLKEQAAQAVKERAAAETQLKEFKLQFEEALVRLLNFSILRILFACLLASLAYHSEIAC